LADHDIYVQAINYPTVARGEERLRFTVTPGHTREQMDHLVCALDQVFTELNIKRLEDWKAEGGRAGVGSPDGEKVKPIWNDKQLGLLDGTAPKTLRNGQKGYISGSSIQTTREKFVDLLGPLNKGGHRLTNSATAGGAFGYPIGPIERSAASNPIAVAA
jgi:5-aminolevulinate synthase